MKIKNKIIIVVTCISLLIAFSLFQLFPLSNAYANENASTKSTQVVSSEALNIYLSKTDIDKSAGSKGEEKTATYLSEFLSTQGCEYWNGSTSYLHEFTIGFGQVSNNVIGMKKSKVENSNTIVISAHYDNTYSQNKSIGALNNATGVVCLMSLVEYFKNVELNFDLIYCFFGASDQNRLGSKAFVSSLNRDMKNKLLLNINIDSIGCGEFNYYYAGDCSNSFVNSFNLENNNINKTPLYSKQKFILTEENLAYSNAGLSSDNIPFLTNNIRSISFFSGNLTSINAGFKESENHENIHNSERDTITNLLEYYPDHMNKINNVANAIIDGIQNPSLIQSLINCYNEVDFSFLNNKFLILALGIFGVLLLCGIKIRNKDKKTKSNDNK